MRINFAVELLLLFSCFAGTLFAQTSKGSIAGSITDQTGAVILGAHITANNSDTGAVRGTSSGELGQYRIDAVEPGRYSVQVTKDGFTPLLLENIRVFGSVLTSVNAKLTPAGPVSQIVVQASALAVQSESGELSHTITTREISDLPVPFLDPYTLATTLPGCSMITDGASLFTNDPLKFACNGARPRANNFLIEGQDNNDAEIHGNALQPENLDAVQEVAFLLNTAPAEFGRGGGAIANLIYKRGTNQFHGSVWERMQNSALDANDHFNVRNGIPKSSYRENLFGFSVGGPIKKDKLFFFASYQWDKYRSSSNSGNLFLPSAAGFATLEQYAANPRIAAMLSAYGPLRGDPNRAGAPPPIPLGLDPSTQLDRGSVEMGVFNRTGVPVDFDQPEFDATGDYIIGPHDTLGLRYIRSTFDTPYDFFDFPIALPGFDAEKNGSWQNAGITFTHVFGPSLLNEARISYGRFGLFFLPRPDNVPLDATATVSIAEMQGWGASQQFPQSRFHNTYQFQDTLSWTRGRHFFRFGFDIADVRARDVVPYNTFGSIQYMNGGGYSALANYLDDFSGGTSTVAQTFGSPIVHASMPLQAYFVEDSWKVRPNLTVEIGLRYEYNGTPANQLQYPAIDFRDPNQLRYPTVGSPGIDYNDLACFPCVVKQVGDTQNFGPRIAFAYSPNFWKRYLGDGQSVLRGGFGIFYDTQFTNILDNTQATSPNSVASAITMPSRFTRAPGQRGLANWSTYFSQLPRTPNPFATEESQVSHLLSPEYLQWHLDYQRELPDQFILDVGYVGTRGEHLFANTFANPFLPNGERLIPSRGTIVIRDNSGDSIYHALQVAMTRHYAHGFLLRASYTLSKLIDDTSEIFNSNPSINGEPGTWWSVPPVQYPVPRGVTDRSLSSFDHRHRLAFSYIYDIPKFTGHDSFTTKLGYVLNGWQIAGTTAFQSGTPYNVITGFDSNGDGVPNDRPSLGNPHAPLASYAFTGDWAGGSPDTLCDGPTLWFSNQCTPVSLSQVHWIVPSSGVGNVGRNSLIGPWYTTWAFSLTRQFTVHEGQSLLLRAEVFNPFNQAHSDGDGYWPNMQLVSGIVPAGSGATSTFANFSTSLHGGRTVRLLLKYSF